MAKYSKLGWFAEHHLITRLNGVQWSWWLRRAKEQCRGSGYSSKPTKEGDRRAQCKGRGGARKKGRWHGYSARPKSSKESRPEVLAKQARSLGRKHWPSKHGVLTGFIGWAMNKSRPNGTTDEQTDAAYRTIFGQTRPNKSYGLDLFCFRSFWAIKWKSSSMLEPGCSRMIVYWFKLETDVGLIGVHLPELAWVCQNPTVCWYQVWQGCRQQDQVLQDGNGSDSVRGNCIWPEGGDGVLINEIAAKWAS